MKQGILIAAFSLMSAFGVAGWLRRPAAEMPQAAYAGFDQAAAPGQWSVATNPAYARPAYYQAPARPAAVRTQRIVRDREYVPRRVVRRGRPFSHSAAIVAGSAGVGAAIGALAGHGKGAAIGALAGGAAGLIYDRATHNRQTSF